MFKRVSLVINNDDDGESSSSSSSSSLSFWKSLVERYKDESKPDPLVFKQMLTWSFQWIEDEQELEEEEVPTTAAATTGSLSQDNDNNDNSNDSFVLSGRLVWKGEHMQVTLHSTCRWKESSLEFVCRASASFRHDFSNDEGDDDKEEKKKKNKKSKISKLMQQRLQQDDYISKLLLPDKGGNDQKNRGKGKTSKTAAATATGNTAFDADTTTPPLLLCQASIRRNGQEERFVTQEDVAEGIRRALWSASTDTLDVIEWIVQYLPLLPTTTAENTKTPQYTNLTLQIYINNSKNNNNEATGTGRKEKVALPSLLAERAQLRLLEDAMYDACDKEEEVEIVETLKISDPTSNKKIKK